MKVRLCNECNGSGEVYERQDAYESTYVECGACGGSGRTVTMRFQEELPYNKDNSLILEYRGKIESLLGELKEKLK